MKKSDPFDLLESVHDRKTFIEFLKALERDRRDEVEKGKIYE